ncbi:MAG: redoxin domain-containing protein [Thermaerobacter sp.]|nr:redoxin domain-containing protein [Thermaerobacter sp.]
MTAQHRARRVALGLAVVMGLMLLGIGVGVLRTGTTGIPVASAPGMPVGARAPSLALPATDGHTIGLSAYRGHPVVVFFYEAAT